MCACLADENGLEHCTPLICMIVRQTLRHMSLFNAGCCVLSPEGVNTSLVDVRMPQPQRRIQRQFTCTLDRQATCMKGALTSSLRITLLVQVDRQAYLHTVDDMLCVNVRVFQPGLKG